MELKIKEMSKTKKEIEVILPPEKIGEYADRAVEIISSGKNISGFRPGKAPRRMVEEMFGKEAVWQEACNLAVKENYSQVMEKNDFPMVVAPEIQVQSAELNKSLYYKIIIEVLPEIILPDYKKIAGQVFKEKQEIKVEEEEIDKTLEAVRQSRAKIKAVTRSAKKGDEVLIDFEGKIGGISQAGLKSEKTPFIIGEEKFIKGFEDQLVGLNSGDSKTFLLEAETSDPRGNKGKKEIEFNVKVHSVSERELPEANDEFAQSFGQFSGLKDLREKLKENIRIEKELKEKNRIRVKILESIAEKTSLDIPESLINRELDNMIEEFKAKLAQSGLSFEEYLKRAQKTEQSFREEWTIDARKRILGGLILEEIAKKENIEVKNEEVEKESNAYLSSLRAQQADLPDPEKLKNYIRSLMKNEKVFQLLEK